MVRLTVDLIWKSPHFFNAIKERELDLRGCLSFLRVLFLFLVVVVSSPTSFTLSGMLFLTSLFSFPGNKIAVIENLGATEVRDFHRLISLLLNL